MAYSRVLICVSFHFQFIVNTASVLHTASVSSHLNNTTAGVRCAINFTQFAIAGCTEHTTVIATAQQTSPVLPQPSSLTCSNINLTYWRSVGEKCCAL